MEDAQTTATPHNPMNGGDAGDATATVPWFESLSDEGLKESMKGFESPEALARAHQELQGKIPQVPATPNDYQVPTIEGAPVSEPMVAWFKEQAHKAGMSQDAAAGLVSSFYEMQAKELEAYQQQAAAQEKQAVDEVMSGWGATARENTQNAERAVAMVDRQVPGFRAWLEESRMGNNPWLIKVFAEVGRAVGEDGWIPGRPGEGAPARERTLDGKPMLRFPSMGDK